MAAILPTIKRLEGSSSFLTTQRKESRRRTKDDNVVPSVVFVLGMAPFNHFSLWRLTAFDCEESCLSEGRTTRCYSGPGQAGKRGVKTFAFRHQSCGRYYRVWRPCLANEPGLLC
jgi:hypothetical protein